MIQCSERPDFPVLSVAQVCREVRERPAYTPEHHELRCAWLEDTGVAIPQSGRNQVGRCEDVVQFKRKRPHWISIPQHRGNRRLRATGDHRSLTSHHNQFMR